MNASLDSGSVNSSSESDLNFGKVHGSSGYIQYLNKSDEHEDVARQVIGHGIWIHLPLIVVTNVLVISATYFIKRLHSPNNLIIGGLAITDLLTGLVTLPLTWLRLHEHKMDYLVSGTKSVCYVSLLGTTIFTALSLSYLFLMSMERFFAIKHPLKYIKYSSMKTAVLVMLVVFVITVLEQVIALSLSSEKWHDGLSGKESARQCKLSVRYPKVYTGVIVHVITVSKILISLILTCWVMFIAKTQIHIQRKESIRLSQDIVANELKRKYSELKITASLNCIFVILWIPSVVFDFVYAADKKGNTKALWWINKVQTHCLHLNAWVNAIVYSISSRTYHKAYRYFLTNYPWNWKHAQSLFRDASYSTSSRKQTNPERKSVIFTPGMHLTQTFDTAIESAEIGASAREPPEEMSTVKEGGV